MSSIFTQWKSFEEVLPDTAPDIQRREMRRAFYAGFHTAVRNIHRMAEDDIGEKEGAAVLEGWAEEVLAFTFSVKDGVA
jgi:hypothetical protein